MEINEVKKSLYKQKPAASLMYIRKGTAYYETHLQDATRLMFEVPVDDMGDADFLPQMDAKLLIRWVHHESEQ